MSLDSTSGSVAPHGSAALVGLGLGTFIFANSKRRLRRLAARLAGNNLDGFKQVLENVKEGASGERGQQYVAAQAFIVLCILGGGVPFLGDTLFIVAGPLAIAVGIAMLAAAIYELGPALSPWTTPAATSTELKIGGIFAYVRHPIYGGLLLLCFGGGVASNSASRLVLTSVLYYLLELKSNLEEAKLEEKYEAYTAYKKNVEGKFFPDPRSLM